MVPALPALDIGSPGPDRPSSAVQQQWLDHEGRLIATGGRLGDAWWMHWRGLATFWFGDAGPVRAEPVRPELDDDLRDIFFRGVVPVVLLARGFEALHASAVVEPAGVIALSGTGKSTIALAIASAGARHFADDTVVYQVTGERPFASGLPFPVRVEGAARQAVDFVDADSSSSMSAAGSAPIHRVYHLVRDLSLDPADPIFAPVPPERRFELLLAHAHPFEMGGDDRRRSFMEHLLTLARSHGTVTTFGIGIRLWLSAGLVRLLKPVVPLGTLVRLAKTGTLNFSLSVDNSREKLDRRLAAYLEKRGRFPFRPPSNCLERSLGVYRLLCGVGRNPQLVVGVRRSRERGVEGHVWVTAQEKVLGERPEDLVSFTTIVTFDADGRQRTAAGFEGTLSEIRVP
jgi:hypothetical protein